jgi:hypothetical protein
LFVLVSHSLLVHQQTLCFPLLGAVNDDCPLVKQCVLGECHLFDNDEEEDVVVVVCCCNEEEDDAEEVSMILDQSVDSFKNRSC